MSDLTDLTENCVGRPSRRQVLVGTAWAVPVVMGVGATPAMAASSVVSVGVTTSGNNGKTVTFTFTFTGAKPNDTVQITSFQGGFHAAQLPGAVTISNNSAVIEVKASTNPGKPKKTYSVTYSVTGLGSKTTTFSY